MSIESYPTLTPVKTNKGTELKQMLEQTWCPKCPSSDAFTVYMDGQKKNGYCFSCGYYSKDPDADLIRSQEGLGPNQLSESFLVSGNSNVSLPESSGSATPRVGRQFGNEHLTKVQEPLKSVGIEEGLLHPVRALNHRGLSFSTCEHFGVRVGVSPTDGETPIYTLFPQYRNNEIVGWKTKTLDKKIVSSGGSETDLFGANLIKPQGKKLWITEGEEDAMAVYQVLKESSSLSDWEPPVVSLATGASSAVSCITRSLSVLEGYEEIILVFDNDAAGKKARDEVCKILAGKVSYVTLPCKDANQMLLNGRGTELKWLVLSSTKKYQPDGIISSQEMWERYTEKKKDKCYPYPNSMSKLNEKTYGVRSGSIVTITSGSGSGKSTFLKELVYHYKETTNEKIAGMFLEEDVSDTIKGLISLKLNRRISLPDVVSDPEEERAAFEDLFGDGRISLYDYFGGMDDGSLLAKLRYFAVTGHKFIFLDHLSIIVSEFAAQGGERERIDTLMTKLAKFVKEFNVVLFLIVHLRKSDSSSASFELGTRPSLDDLRGSGSLKQLSWDVIGLSRNQQHEDTYCANTTEVSVLKCRFTGRTGTAGYLHYDSATGRLIPVDEPVGYRKRKRNNDEVYEF
jgi:twinkle protein